MMVQMENDPKMASKPEQVREKIVMGKMNKFYSENCLLQQEFVRGDVFTGSVEQYIADAAKKLGGKMTIGDAIRFEKGEGIEKKQENFAEEIASMVKHGDGFVVLPVLDRSFERGAASMVSFPALPAFWDSRRNSHHCDLPGSTAAA